MSKVFIATPTYSGTLCLGYVESLFAGLGNLADAGHSAIVRFLPGNCYIALARNQMVSQFMETDCTDLIFIDDDLAFDADGLSKLLSHDVDIVGGSYPMKTDQTGNYPVRLLCDEGRPRVKDGLLASDGIPTGFMRIRRSVIEKMMETYPEREFKDSRTDKTHFDLFACERSDGLWWGEDFRFCQLAIGAGFSIWVEPNINFKHYGNKAWEGNYHEFLMSCPGGKNADRA